MKLHQLLVAATVLLSVSQPCYGLATEQIGADRAGRHTTIEQPGWPAGLAKALAHDSRVYSIWVNGNENFYFQSTTDEIEELIQLYSEIRLRDHVVTIKTGRQEVRTFKGEKIAYNVNLHLLDGIALFTKRRQGAAQTFEPTLTIHIDAGAHRALLKQIEIPDNVIVKTDLAGWPVKRTATQPKRELWHAHVLFDDETAAADFSNNVLTRVTLWEAGEEHGLKLGEISHKGQFATALSDEEVAALRAGRLWLTLTVGNPLTTPSKNDVKLGIENMSTDPLKVKAVEVGKPRFYHGRILFEDGSAAIIDRPPWPSAEITVTFPYAGSLRLDRKGAFKVFLTPEQFEDLKARKTRGEIYVPDLKTRGQSTALYSFPAEALSLEKANAGEVRISRPRNDNEE